jgi:hypothetical protein
LCQYQRLDAWLFASTAIGAKTPHLSTKAPDLRESTMLIGVRHFGYHVVPKPERTPKRNMSRAVPMGCHSMRLDITLMRDWDSIGIFNITSDSAKLLQRLRVERYSYQQYSLFSSSSVCAFFSRTAAI